MTGPRCAVLTALLLGGTAAFASQPLRVATTDLEMLVFSEQVVVARALNAYRISEEYALVELEVKQPICGRRPVDPRLWLYLQAGRDLDGLRSDLVDKDFIYFLQANREKVPAPTGTSLVPNYLPTAVYQRTPIEVYSAEAERKWRSFAAGKCSYPAS